MKYEGSYQSGGMGKDDGKGQDGRNRGAWQKGYINNLIGGQGGSKDSGRDRKDKRSK